MKTTEIDHRGTDEIVCPHCGHAYSESYEFTNNSGIENCEECQRSFRYRRDVLVSYTTETLLSDEQREKLERLRRK